LLAGRLWGFRPTEALLFFRQRLTRGVPVRESRGLLHNHLMSDLKPTIPYEVFESLDIRVGRIVEIEPAEDAPKKSYKIRVDFGKYGIKTSVGRFTQHEMQELKGRLILGVLNFEPRQIGSTTSEFLTLGVQFPKADSGEATLITTMNENVKIGSKLF
jgi:tRNA-binding protein